MSYMLSDQYFMYHSKCSISPSSLPTTCCNPVTAKPYFLIAEYNKSEFLEHSEKDFVPSYS